MTEAEFAPFAPFDRDRLAEVVADRGLGLGTPLFLAQETCSTNDDAKQGARDGALHGATWLAESQTLGRGRQGRAWLSPHGENLLFSVLMRMRCVPARVPPLSLAVGLVVRDAIASALGACADLEVMVKWPNDVLVRSPHDGVLRKIAGVLVESAVVGLHVEYVIVGIGLNVHTRAFHESVAGVATSVALERDARNMRGPCDRVDVLADVLAGLERVVPLVVHQGLSPIRGRLARYDSLAGKDVESTDIPPTLRGVASGIDASGCLLVKHASGTLTRVSSGELRLRSPCTHET